jgi:hypothetical protein
MKHFSLACAAVLLAAFTAGCEAQPEPKAPPPRAAAPVEINREVAIRTARTDAQTRYGDGWIAWVDATQLGRYWVVELRAAGGKGMRYAISTSDGSIRQRSIFQ